MLGLTHSHTMTPFEPLGNEPFPNTVKLLDTSNFSFTHSVSTSLENFLLFTSNSKLSSADCFNLNQSKILSSGNELEHFQIEIVCRQNFKFDEKGRKFSKQVENTEGKGEIARFKQFLLFPVFSKDLYCRHVKSRDCLGKG